MPIPETPHKIKVIFADEDNIKNKMKINEKKLTVVPELLLLHLLFRSRPVEADLLICRFQKSIH